MGPKVGGSGATVVEAKLVAGVLVLSHFFSALVQPARALACAHTRAYLSSSTTNNMALVKIGDGYLRNFEREF